MSTRRKRWSDTVEHLGVGVRVYERANSSRLWLSVTIDGQKRRQSSKTTDRETALRRAAEWAEELVRLRLTGDDVKRLSAGDLFRLYLHRRGPKLSDQRRKFMDTTLGLFERFLGSSRPIDEFTQNLFDDYLDERTSGRLTPDDRRASDSPSVATIRNELDALRVVCRWGCAERRGGSRPLLPFDPTAGIERPKPKNVARPTVDRDRYATLLGVADDADPEGRLRTLLVLAWESGRRITAITHLRASDVLFTADQLRRAFDEEGERRGDDTPDIWGGGIRWRPEFDKKGYLTFSPLSSRLREALVRYVQRRGVVGDAWLFPANAGPETAMDKNSAYYYLRKAEKLAGLPHQKRGGWHAFRRRWATDRKHLPLPDVMEAGGWRSPDALETAYQQSDAKTVLEVMEGA